MTNPPLQIRQIIPLFELPAVNRKTRISSWDYKQHYSLAIAFIPNVGDPDCCALLLSLAKQYCTYRDLDTEILAIAHCPTVNEVEQLRTFVTEHNILFPVLWDTEGRVREAYLGTVQAGIFVGDRYGELYMQAIANHARELPQETEIREWVEYVDMQCAECFPPPWR